MTNGEDGTDETNGENGTNESAENDRTDEPDETEFSVHRPTFGDTTVAEWTFPRASQFDSDDLSAVAEHFLVSTSGFEEPDHHSDLKLPVVNTRGYLNLNALWVARSGPYSVEAIEGIDEETKREVRAIIDELGNENFENYEYEYDTLEPPRSAESKPEPKPEETIVAAGRVDGSRRRAAVGLLFLLCVRVLVELSWGSREEREPGEKR